MKNGILSKDMILFQVNIQYLTNDAVQIIKNSQVTLNWYTQVGLTQLYDRFDIQILSNGFIFTKELGPLANNAINLMNTLGITSYEVQYIFTTYDVAQTEVFRMRLFAVGAGSYLPNANSVHSTCETRFTNQQCDVLLQKLNYYKASSLKIQIVNMYYSHDTLVTNYTKIIDNVYFSCFTTGNLIYNQKNKTL
ncbi:Hypothetical_protein [Hexamita inflata]|uniref:Hypothetical_protein n=1 Tax=Hexamita inflata TaxID=28002 RepID=A0AA86RPJ8_9EUKA|nr:Hypothetical protein HINF_LOCUS64943 [Hexamita inflata]